MCIKAINLFSIKKLVLKTHRGNEINKKNSNWYEGKN